MSHRQQFKVLITAYTAATVCNWHLTYTLLQHRKLEYYLCSTHQHVSWVFEMKNRFSTLNQKCIVTRNIQQKTYRDKKKFKSHYSKHCTGNHVILMKYGAHILHASYCAGNKKNPYKETQCSWHACTTNSFCAWYLCTYTYQLCSLYAFVTAPSFCWLCLHIHLHAV